MTVALALVATFPLVLLPVLLGSTGVKTNPRPSAERMSMPWHRALVDLVGSRPSNERTERVAAEEPWFTRRAQS